MKLPIPDYKIFLRWSKKIKSEIPSKFIFTGKQWIIILVVLVLLAGITAFGTWFTKTRIVEAEANKKAEEAAFYAGDEQLRLFERGRIVIPQEFRGERTREVGIYRYPHKSWSDEEIRGKTGEKGYWTDPATISTDIFEDKNDQLIKNLLEDVR